MIGLDKNQQLTLFKLRARLLWRQFTGEKGRIVTAIVVITVFAPMVFGLAIGSAIGYLRLEAPWPAQLLGGILVMLWLVWGIAPIFLGSINSSIDVSRLLVYPVSRGNLALSILLGTFLDYPTFLIIPLFAAVVVGWIGSAAWPVVLVGLPIAYIHMVIIGQIVMVGLGNILQSRRFRDLTIIVFSIGGASCYFFSQGVGRLVGEFVDPEAAEAFFTTWRPLDQLQWLPTGAVARAIERAAVGDGGAAAIWLGYAVVLLVILGWIWVVLLDRLMAGYSFVVPGWRTAKKESPSEHNKSRRLRLGFVAEPLRSLLIKEWTLMWRIPQRRIGVIQSYLLPVIFSGIFLFGGEDLDSAQLFGGGNRRLPLLLIGFAYLAILGFAGNSFAWEGRGLSMMFLTPAARQAVIRAKTIVALIVTTGPLLFYAPIIALVSPPIPVLAGFFVGIGLASAGTSVAMLFSVWFPFPVNTDPKKPFARPERRGGFIPTVMTIFAAPILTAIVGSPLAVPIALVWVFSWDRIGLIAAVLSAVYGVAVAWWAGRPVGNQLIKREPEIIEALVVPEGD